MEEREKVNNLFCKAPELFKDEGGQEEVLLENIRLKAKEVVFKDRLKENDELQNEGIGLRRGYSNVDEVLVTKL